jgi:polysaccharide export outer membrane protein
MRIRPIALFAALLLSASPVLYSQVDCSDAFSAPSEGCSSSARGTSPGAPVRPLTRATAAGSEGASLGGKDVVLVQDQSIPPDVPTEFQNFVAGTIGQQLPIYGVSLFHNVPSTFSPSDLAPVTADYVIGPEDELRIRIWGQVSYSGNLRVDRSGNIFLPEAGSVHVAGLQYSALDQHLRAALARVYRNFDLSVDMGRIRSIQIYVTGQARRPGVYTVSSLSTLVDALFASGGPSPQGSLRHMQLKREGKVVADFDLYALLMHGDKSKDVRLLPEDILYIPNAGPQVAILGSVRNVGIFELRGSETIGDLMALAGGTTAIASNARVSLERLGHDRARQAMEFSFDAAGQAAPLADGDIVRVFSILPNYQKTVTLRGNVANPGRFGWRPNMHLSDLIPDRESLETRNYWWNRSRLGFPGMDFAPIGKTGSGTANVGGTSIAESVTPSNPNVDVHILSPEINWRYAVIERLNPDTLRTTLISFDLGKLVLEHDASQDLALQPSDTVTIFTQADINVPLDEQTKYVRLEGEFVRAGIYSVLPGETLRDLVARAGGFTGKAYLYGSEFMRESARVLQQQRLDAYVRSLEMDLERNSQAMAVSAANSPSAQAGAAAANMAVRGSEQSLVAKLAGVRATGRIVLQLRPNSAGIEEVPAIDLEDRDRFVVPSAPAMVNVVGSVFEQGSFLFQRDEQAWKYLKLAGGPTRNADARRTFILRADGSVVNRADSRSHWGNGFEGFRMYPGDTLVVPEKILRPNGMRMWMDWAQTLSGMALSAEVVKSLN